VADDLDATFAGGAVRRVLAHRRRYEAVCPHCGGRLAAP